MDLDHTLSSRARLLYAGKTLFARQGYEQTSTSAIARTAGTSESQLIRYFTGKAGLLQAIFEDSWGPLNNAMHEILASEQTSRDALVEVLTLMINAFAADHDFAFLVLFEGRRMRGGTHDVFLSDGFRNFAGQLDKLIERGTRDGTFPPAMVRAAVMAGLIGCAEGMAREMIMADRSGQPAPYGGDEIREVFRAVLDGLSRSGHSSQ